MMSRDTGSVDCFVTDTYTYTLYPKKYDLVKLSLRY